MTNGKCIVNKYMLTWIVEIKKKIDKQKTVTIWELINN